MTAYLRRSTLSVGGLALTLKNELGQLQDAEYVLWTVSSAHSGRRASGIGMKAIRRGVGQYYAPWYADDPTGAYEILWEYRRDSSCPIEKATERFFVMDLDNPTCKCGHIRDLPPPGGHVFEPGARCDLTLRLTGASGMPADGFGVLWRIECSKGCVIVLFASAVRLGVGLYGVDWVVSVHGGQYFIRWQWSEFPNAPLQEAIDTFQVVNPRCPGQGVQPTESWTQIK
jgi:hypothetical protein